MAQILAFFAVDDYLPMFLLCEIQGGNRVPAGHGGLDFHQVTFHGQMLHLHCAAPRTKAKLFKRSRVFHGRNLLVVHKKTYRAFLSSYLKIDPLPTRHDFRSRPQQLYAIKKWATQKKSLAASLKTEMTVA